MVIVEDSGPGFDPAILPYALEPFVTSRPPGEGTGLGLSIARDVASAHGGAVQLGSSTALGGAEVRFSVSLRHPA